MDTGTSLPSLFVIVVPDVFALQNCAYLCNMAVDADHRRKGYGNILLAAADDIAEIAVYRYIFASEVYFKILSRRQLFISAAS